MLRYIFVQTDEHEKNQKTQGGKGLTATTKHPVATPSEILQLTVSTINGGIPVLHCQGELDMLSSPWLEGLAQEKIDSGHSRFVIDLSEVYYMDASCLNVLIGILKQVREKEGIISLVYTSDMIHKIFDICLLKRHFPHSSTVDESANYLAKHPTHPLVPA